MPLLKGSRPTIRITANVTDLQCRKLALFILFFGGVLRYVQATSQSMCISLAILLPTISSGFACGEATSTLSPAHHSLASEC